VAAEDGGNVGANRRELIVIDRKTKRPSNKNDSVLSCVLVWQQVVDKKENDKKRGVTSVTLLELEFRK